MSLPLGQLQLLAFPDQPLTLEELEAVTQHFGPFGDDPYIKAMDGHPHVIQIRRDANDALKKLEKDHSISEDEGHGAHDEIQKLTDDSIKTIDESVASKETEILQV